MVSPKLAAFRLKPGPGFFTTILTMLLMLVQGAWKFEPPVEVRSLGLCAPAAHAIGAHEHVSVAVVMPANCFHEKDYRRHIYHAKRVMYLHRMAEHLASSKLVRSQEWCFINEDPRCS